MKPSSKQPLRNATPTTSVGSASARDAIEVARILRADGFHVGSIRVGDVELSLAIITNPGIPATMMGGKPESALEVAKSIYEEWGGPDFAKKMGSEPDLVDDDEQPAVRS